MKIRESGMPEEDLWSSFFDVDSVLTRLGCVDPGADLVEFGCGYGTFTVAAATRTQGTVFAFDIDPEMVEITLRKLHEHRLSNVRVALRDFVEDGTGLTEGCAGCALLFNILHAEDPLKLLCEARRILRPGGKAGIIHWNYDPATPRGPDLSIRPRPEQCQAWMQAAGFALAIRPVALAPYHYGLVGQKPADHSP